MQQGFDFHIGLHDCRVVPEFLHFDELRLQSSEFLFLAGNRVPKFLLPPQLFSQRDRVLYGPPGRVGIQDGVLNRPNGIFVCLDTQRLLVQEVQHDLFLRLLAYGRSVPSDFEGVSVGDDIGPQSVP